jgi:hypothetical protein
MARPLKIAVSGTAGLVGGALCASLAAAGHSVIRLVRRPPLVANEARWDAARGVIDLDRLEGADAVIHLAGENIAAGRWTTERMDAIRRSRIDGTRALVESLAGLRPRPAAFLCASAVGIYGERGSETLDEDSPPGQGFLAELCQEWERAAQGAVRLGMRCVPLRFGVVLAREGGMLKRMLTPFRLGLGGPIGSGRQYVSWVSMDDLCGAVAHILGERALRGPVNIVAPVPVTSRDFARTLGRVLHRPAILRMPASVLRLAFGRLADEAMLASAHVWPGVLVRTGYAFRHFELQRALEALVGRG